MEKFHKGSWYSVTFWDHVLGQSQGLKCKICGMYLKYDKKSNSDIFTFWQCVDDDSENNVEYIAIFRPAIIKSKALRT